MTGESRAHSSPPQDPLPRGLLIAWHPYSRRGQLLCGAFRLELKLIHSLKRHYLLAPIRYVLQAAKSFTVLIRERPRLIFVQNPPIFAVVIVYVYAKLWGARYVIDSHTGALLAPWWKWSLPAHAFLSRNAITTIVTNRHLKAVVDSWGASSFILGDLPTAFPEGSPFQLDARFNMAVINTFSPDEPVEEVLKAASGLPEVHFYVTGNLIRAQRSLLQDQPDNVTFTGFLPDNEYFGLLRSVQAIMTLTTDNFTMQRGACEALWLGKPIITSDWPILREYFHKGTIHVDNSARGIQEAVIWMQNARGELEGEIRELQRERRQESQHTQAAMEHLISDSES